MCVRAREHTKRILCQSVGFMSSEPATRTCRGRRKAWISRKLSLASFDHPTVLATDQLSSSILASWLALYDYVARLFALLRSHWDSQYLIKVGYGHTRTRA